MYSLINTSQILFNALLGLLFVIIAFKYYRIPTKASKLFALGMLVLSIIQILYLIINAQILTGLMDYQFASYLLYVGSVFIFLLSSSEIIKPSLKNPIQTVLILLFIISIFLLILSRVISSPLVYELNYLLSFNNSTYLNIFSIVLSISIVLASIGVHSTVKNRRQAGMFEFFFLLIAFSMSINLVSSSLIFKLVSSGVMLVSMAVITMVHSDFYSNKSTKKT